MAERPRDDGGDASVGTGDGRGSDDDADAAAATQCPSCGESLPAGGRFCPACATVLDEDGAAVDPASLRDDLLPADPSRLSVADRAGRRRASGPVRALAGLAVSVPLAPLVLFLVGSVATLSTWTAALVFLGGWLGPAALLSRSRVPAEAFGRSLYLVAVGTLLVPVALAAGGIEAWEATLGLSFEVLAAVTLAVAAALVVLGRFVTGQARV